MQNTERILKTQQLENKQPNKKWAKYSNTHFTKEDIDISQVSTRQDVIIGNWGNNIKTAVRYHVYLSE